MHLRIKNLSKRFDSGWIFKNLDYELESGSKLAIKGPNGSGKSSLLAILSGYLSPSTGKVVYQYKNTVIDRDDIYKLLSISVAYGELDEELTPLELYRHYARFKPFQCSSEKEFIEIAQLGKDANRMVNKFSSGMKQRLSLALAICADTPLLLLDEPGSFLDKDRKQWFRDTLKKYGNNKTVVIASNDDSDLFFCDQSIELNSFQSAPSVR